MIMPLITALYAGLLGLLAFAVAIPAGRRFIGAIGTVIVTLISSTWLIVKFLHH